MFFAPNMKEGFGVFFMIAFFGAIIGLFIQSGSEDRQKKKPAYKALEEALERDVAAILNPRVTCPACSATVQFDAMKLALAEQSTVWQCPTCRGPVRGPSDG